MFLRYGIEDSNFISRMFVQNDLQNYYEMAKPLQSSKELAEGPLVIGEGKVLVIAGGRSSIASGYGTFGPSTLMCYWKGFTTPAKPNVQVVRKKQTFGANYTAVVFGAIIQPLEKDNKRFPVYNMRAVEMDRASLSQYLKTILAKK
jgi:hypothetical protein